jgi:hypothetical protein
MKPGIWPKKAVFGPKAKKRTPRRRDAEKEKAATETLAKICRRICAGSDDEDPNREDESI